MARQEAGGQGAKGMGLAMSYATISKANEVFNWMLVAILMPFALLLGVSVGALFAAVLGVAIYAGLAFLGLRYIVRRSFSFAKSFGKRGGLAGEKSPSSSPRERAALPGEFSPEHKREVWDGRQTAHRKWLQ